MVSLVSIVALGFFLGMRHATDPDHVVAVTTIVSRERSVGPAAFIGALWGLGHTLTIFIVGAAIILVGWVIPVRVGLSMDFSVGLMLIVLGILNLTGFMKWTAESFASEQGLPTFPHVHPHTRGHESGHEDSGDTPLAGVERIFGRLGFYQAIRPAVVGIVHGLAGSAAVALLVLTTIRDPHWAMLYLLVFGVGTIAGMMLITAAIAVPFTYASRSNGRLNHGLRIATGLFSLGFGLFLSYQTGIVSGLFTAHPQWTPR